MRSPCAMVRCSSRKTSTPKSLVGLYWMRRPSARRDREQVGLAIDRFDAGVAAFGNRGLFASTGEADHIAFFIVVSDRPLDSRKAAIH